MDLSTYVAKYIKQTMAYPTHHVVTKDEFNDILNLLITQGDYNTDALETAMPTIRTAVSSSNILSLLYDTVTQKLQLTIDGVAWVDVGQTEITLVPHTHGNITADGKLPVGNKLVATDANGTITTMDGISAATPNTVMQRDANGRSQVVAPIVDADIANKGYVDLAIMQSPISQKNLLNILQLKLQQTLKATDIDAWSDLLADATGIDAANSCGYVVSGSSVYGSYGKSLPLSSGTAGTFVMGTNTTNMKVGFNFVIPDTLGIPFKVTQITQRMNRSGSPTSTLTMKIYATAGGLPVGDPLYTAAPIVGSTLTTSFTNPAFIFTDAVLQPGVTYAGILEISGSPDGNNYYSSTHYSAGVGTKLTFDGAVWTSAAPTAMDGAITYVLDNCVIRWNSVVPTEALMYIGLCADFTIGTGTLTWYMSDDGTSWVPVTLDTIQTVNFDQVALYLKCIVTGNSTIAAVAYGGY
jgi:hypothetical protein